MWKRKKKCFFYWIFLLIFFLDVQCPSLEELRQQQNNNDNNNHHNPYRDDPNRLASKTGYHMHDRIRFSCKDGYRLYGSHSEVKCLPNGHWSHSFPICQGRLLIHQQWQNKNPIYYTCIVCMRKIPLIMFNIIRFGSLLYELGAEISVYYYIIIIIIIMTMMMKKIN